MPKYCKYCDSRSNGYGYEWSSCPHNISLYEERASSRSGEGGGDCSFIFYLILFPLFFYYYLFYYLFYFVIIVCTLCYELYTEYGIIRIFLFPLKIILHLSFELLIIASLLACVEALIYFGFMEENMCTGWIDQKCVKSM